MDWSQIWPVIAVAVGGSGFLTVGVREFGKWRSGRESEEQQENLTLAQRIDLAEAWREYEATYRRLISEHCSHARRIAIEHGAPLDAIGSWPKPPDKPKSHKD